MNPWVRRAIVAAAPMVLAKARQMYEQRQGSPTTTSSRRSSTSYRGRPVSSGSRWGSRSR